MSDAPQVLVTCEHGGNWIPSRYRALFVNQGEVLEGHRGWDPGALPLARSFARTLGAPLHFSTTTRLLVDLNRSLSHPQLFSRFSRGLSPEERGRVLMEWYHPYREKVREWVGEKVRGKSAVLHLSIHTFTPVLHGKVREVDVGLLYDPARAEEKGLCREVREVVTRRLGASFEEYRICFNRPYLGRSDGLTTWLRGQDSANRYLGIEVEVNQGLIRSGGRRWNLLRRALVKGFRETVSGEGITS
jgi:predicted N-formylglutamate amidohydrolase